MMADSFLLCLIQRSIGIGSAILLLAVNNRKCEHKLHDSKMEIKWFWWDTPNDEDSKHLWATPHKWYFKNWSKIKWRDRRKNIPCVILLFFSFGRNCWMARLDGELETIVNQYCHILCYIINLEWNREISIKMPDMAWQAAKYPHTHPISWYEWI